MKVKQLSLFFFLFISFGTDAQIDIYEIARNGCAEDLQMVFNNYPNIINVKNKSGFSPLTIASYSGNLEIATLLAKHVENIDLNSNVGTPLMAAVYRNNNDIAKMLLDSGADVNITDAKGTTALHYAIKFKNADLIKVLVNNGADINLKDNKGLSPLDYAKIDNNKNIVELLKI